MAEDLLENTESYLLPAIRELGMRVVDGEQFTSFDNASVTLAGPGIRLRIVRERSQVFADFGPPSEPQTWYDSAVVMDFLGLSNNAGFHDTNEESMLTGLASFMRSFHPHLQEAFSERCLPTTKTRLEALKAARSKKMFGA